MDVLHVHPKGEGQGWSESLPQGARGLYISCDFLQRLLTGMGFLQLTPHHVPHFGRIAEMDVLYVHPKGEGQDGLSHSRKGEGIYQP